MLPLILGGEVANSAIKIAHHSSAIDHRSMRADAAILCELDQPNMVHVYERETQRSDVGPLADLPPPLEATCRALLSRPDVDAIRVLAFPVRAGPAAGAP